MKTLKKISIISFMTIMFITNKNYASNPNLPEYRVLIMGNGNYEDPKNNLHGAVEDPYKLEEMLEKNYFYENTQIHKKNIKTKFNLEGNDILKEIKEFFKNNTDKDISYIYYGGHGAIVDGQSSIIGVDMRAIAVSDLELALRDLKGHFVIILDSCNSGGFTEEEILDKGIKVKNPLRNTKYSIITAAKMDENSREEEIDRNWGYSGLFTKTILDGMGYQNNFKADENNDGIITLGELYKYSTKNLSYSHPTIYTNNENLILGGKKTSKVELDKVENWKYQYKNISSEDIWKIRFDAEVSNKTINNNIYFLTEDGVQIKVLDYKLHDDKKGIDIPNYKYLEKDKKYKLIIDENLESKTDKHNKNLTIEFKTK